MALFGTQRDVSLIRNINRELLGDIITQQCAVYKLNLEETRVNIYGESSGAKYYQDPVLLNVLLERGDQTYNSSDMGIDYSREVEFRFFRDDLVDASLVIEPGDILLYYESYFEVDSIKDNQLFVGKDPRYPYNSNPLNPGLENFGTNLSIICKTHYTPADRVQITRERL
jgi:hypothetical protein|tara:strand:- start:52 stop:561 length:510 start_codon:yes stop_codon:yes gene_type:complete